MQHAEFSRVIKKQQDACKEMLVDKAAEYATDDLLHNFKVSAAMSGGTMQQALAGMMVKHTTSIYDMIRKNEDFPMEKWEEKITDHINYLLLLKAVVVEQKNLNAKKG